MSVPGRIGSHQSDLDAAVEKRGSTVISFAPLREPVGELRDLRGEDVLAQVAADQHDQLRLLEVERLGRAEPLAERELVADVARPAALREGRLGAVRRAVRLHHGAEEARADPVREERHRLRPVLLLDRRSSRSARNVSASSQLTRSSGLLRPPRRSMRVLEAVGVVEQVDARVAAGAQPALRQRVVGVALDPHDPAVDDARQDAAAPEAHLAVAWRRARRASAPWRPGEWVWAPAVAAAAVGRARRGHRAQEPSPRNRVAHRRPLLSEDRERRLGAAGQRAGRAAARATEDRPSSRTRVGRALVERELVAGLQVLRVLAVDRQDLVLHLDDPAHAAPST